MEEAEAACRATGGSNREKWCGGVWDGSHDSRLRVIQALIESQNKVLGGDTTLPIQN
jgi:hypothetical protein